MLVRGTGGIGQSAVTVGRREAEALECVRSGCVSVQMELSATCQALPVVPAPGPDIPWDDDGNEYTRHYHRSPDRIESQTDPEQLQQLSTMHPALRPANPSHGLFTKMITPRSLIIEVHKIDSSEKTESRF